MTFAILCALSYTQCKHLAEEVVIDANDMDEFVRKAEQEEHFDENNSVEAMDVKEIEGAFEEETLNPQDEACKNEYSAKYCDRFIERRMYCKWGFIKKRCCATCSAPEVKKAPLKNGECRDLKSKNYCNPWKRFCKRSFMKRYCCATCNRKETPKKLTFKPLPQGGAKLTNEDEKCLQSANKYRKWHPGTSMLKLDPYLTEKAQEWAEHLIKNNMWEHDTDGNNRDNTGENMAKSEVKGSGTISNWKTPKGQACANSDGQWYAEIGNYDFQTGKQKKGRENRVIGHFTQMVWKTAQKVGFGVAYGVDSDGWHTVLTVAKYWPPGNYGGQYTQNVLPQNKGDEGTEFIVEKVAKQIANDEVPKE